MNHLRRFAVVMIVLILAPAAWGEDAPGTWKDQAELAYVDTSGNTDVTTLSAKNKLTYQFTDRITGLWKVEILNGKSDGERNAESYFSELRSDYACTDLLYYYAQASWLKDRFADIDSRTVLGAGSGYKFLTGPKHLLVGEAGLTYTIEKLTDDSDDQYVGGRLFSQYDYQINDTSTFTQNAELFLDLEQMSNYRLNTETALTTALNSLLSFKTSYVIKYDNEPADGTEHTDTILAASLVANF
ncbi:DUF481 domain-containing protein [uncultured Desulfuromonas sp.]|uniref:DUF481 domain-containing protein n=1 Tax=uncultured Desulfuromonas sp. TaxID=181013 RepID=UPI002AABA51F|nr:DUF481 domain-containing protein [uncultured Desulfuromonas sp.]